MTIASNSIFVNQSPIQVGDGAVVTYSVRYKNNIDSFGSMEIYKNGSSDESTTMLSGALAKSGNILTLKTIDFTGQGGSNFIAAWTVTVNGQTVVTKCEFICKTRKSRV